MLTPAYVSCDGRYVLVDLSCQTISDDVDAGGTLACGNYFSIERWRGSFCHSVVTRA